MELTASSLKNPLSTITVATLPTAELIAATLAASSFLSLGALLTRWVTISRLSILFDEIRYFFYITNRADYVPEQIVSLANGRCHQENVIEQLKNGVNAMRMPVDDLLSNWAYMVMTSLAWNLKAWFGLLLPNVQRGTELIKMEFRRFLHAIVLLPAQIVRTGRRVIYRIMSYTSWLKDLFAAWEHLRWLRAT